jgi:hypothetical protein
LTAVVLEIIDKKVKVGCSSHLETSTPNNKEIRSELVLDIC